MAKEFNLYKSRKGSYAVTASELHDLLDFNPGMFTIHIKRWLKDSYIFDNDIRRPIVLKDFSVRLRSEQKGVTDYFLSLPLAKQIVLHSGAKNKMEIARKIMKYESEAVVLKEKEVLNILRLVRIMSRTSYQELAEKMHFAYFERQNNTMEWEDYRTDMINNHASLAHKLSVQWNKKTAESVRKKCLSQQPNELIRIAVMDFLMSKGKSVLYASKMAGLAKDFADEWEISIYEDNVSAHLFAPTLDTEKMNALLFATSA
ncbi:MAG: hypothetical protein ACK5BH_15765 [Bacteroidota bacterium]|jgi:hypothetical protein